MSKLTRTTAPTPLFRLARKPDPWAWPPWPFCRKANRWDDPSETDRVLYACSQRRGTFVETLARFRPDPAVVAGLAEIDGDDEGALAPGEVPISWLTARAMGCATLVGHFADVGQSESLAYLQTALAARLIHYGIRELDGGVISEARRDFTQEISLHVFSAPNDDGSPPYAGIAYVLRVPKTLTPPFPEILAP